MSDLPMMFFYPDPLDREGIEQALEMAMEKDEECFGREDALGCVARFHLQCRHSSVLTAGNVETLKTPGWWMPVPVSPGRAGKITSSSELRFSEPRFDASDREEIEKALEMAMKVDGAVGRDQALVYLASFYFRCRPSAIRREIPAAERIQ